MLTIVVPIYNERIDVLKKCLDSLMSEKTEVIVVEESGGTEKSLVNLAKGYRYNFISTKRRGVSAARNRGWRAARNQWVFFLDADEYLSKNFLTEIGRILSKYKNNKRVGALCVDSKRVVTTLISRIRDVHMSRYTEQKVPRIFKKTVLHELGGFDENLDASEDMDLRDRLLKRYAMKAVPLHYNHIQMQTFKEFMAKNTWLGRDYIRNMSILPKDTVIFYGLHFFYLFPLFALFYPLLIVPWIVFEVVNVSIFFKNTRNYYAFFVPLFDFLKAFFVYTGLVTQKRVK